LWVPETRFGVVRGQPCIRDQSSEDVSASDAVKVGEGSGRGFGEVWWSLVEGAVGAVTVEVVEVGREDSFEVAAGEDQEWITWLRRRSLSARLV
jgi:hypothetical protein